MPTTVATRLLNNVINGTTNSAQLQTALGDSATYSHWQTLFSSVSHISMILDSDTAWAAVRDSNLALASLMGSKEGLTSVISYFERLENLRSNKARLAVAVSADTTSEGTFNGLTTFNSYHSLPENAIASNNTSNVQGVTYANGLFLGAGVACVVGSPDGITWTKYNIPVFASGDQVYSVTYGAGKYLAVGAGGKVATSTDLITWTLQTVSTWGGDAALSIVYNGSNLFVICGPNGKIATSPDGITWTMRTSNQGTNALWNVTFYGGIYTVVGAAGCISTSADAITWTARTALSGASTLKSVAYNGSNLYVAVGDNSTSEIFTTTNPTTAWTARTTPSSLSNNGFYAATYGNGIFVVVGSSGSVITSTDGITWTRRSSSSTSSSLNGIAFGNATFVYGTAEGEIGTSANGTAWRSSKNTFGLTNNAQINTTKYINNLFLIGGGTSGGITTIGYSSDGIKWYSLLVSDAYGESIYSIAYGNGIYMVGSTSGKIWTSSDLETWTLRSSPTTNSIVGLEFGNGMFVMASTAGLWTSLDGITWASRSVPSFSFGSISLNCLSFVGGYFFFVGTADGVGYYALSHSPDGITWSLAPTLFTSGITLSGRVAYGNGVYVVGGTSGQIWVSSDRINWVNSVTTSPGVFGASYSCKSIIFANQLFLACGANNKLAYSRDGYRWTQLPSSLPATNQLYDIAYGSGTFVAGGGGGTGYIISNG